MNEFSFLVGFGASLGLWRVSQNRLIRNPWFWLTAGLIALLGALLGARLGFAAVRSPYFLLHPLEILQFSAGGLSGSGAVVGGLAAIALLSRMRRVPFGALSDGLLPMLPGLVVFTWLGCWMAGAGYGLPMTASEAGSLPAIDENGITLNRVPVQLLSALLLALLFFLLEFIYQPVHSGQRSALSLVCLGTINFGSSFLRADPAPIWSGLRLDGWASLALAAAGLLWLLIIFVRRSLVQPTNF
jgi:phosphatidylglycerol---prolipoprotein diacylglyceryl transferase